MVPQDDNRSLDDSSSASDRERRDSSKKRTAFFVVAWILAGCLVVPAEWERWTETAVATSQGLDDAPPPVAPPPLSQRLIRWTLTDWNLDSTPFFWLLLVAPLCWIRRSTRRATAASRPATGGVEHETGQAPVAKERAWLGSRRATTAAVAIISLVSWLASAWVAGRPVTSGNHSATAASASPRFGDLPPAYHDEYSYLFQAKTTLAGRWWFPSHPDVPELFDQMHVLNEGKFASRYFPGTGVWMAPFVSLGHPSLGHRLAGCLLVVSMFLAGRELGGFRVGTLAGLLAAFSPGLALFSNLLLGHHPTLAGLGLFLAAMLRFQRVPTASAAALAGSGLAFAMLCRPMTAAGFALPFGLWMAAWIMGRPARSSAVPTKRRWICAAAMALPLVAGSAVLAVQNQAVTGDWRTTPYQVYTDIYTPRHVYGFDNVTRGERNVGPRTLENYDRWAENLTPALAARNVGRRAVASGQWTLGLVPILASLVVFCGLTLRSDARWKWILASIVSLHVVHIPYWFDGIMHWHYVFETAPLLLLIVAGATDSALVSWTRDGRGRMAVWWGGVLAASLATAYVVVDFFLLFLASVAVCLVAVVVAARRRGSARPAYVAGVAAGVCLLAAALHPGPFWPISRLEAAVSEVGFSRGKYAAFRDRVAKLAAGRPTLVLVRPDPADRHLDYVTNAPALDSPILVGRFGKDLDLSRVRRAFPDRLLLVFDAATLKLGRVPEPR